MRSFKLHLIEAAEKENEDLEGSVVLQKIVDMIDEGHLKANEQKISINVGKFIKDKRYNDLYLVIKQGSGEKHLAKGKSDDSFAIFLYADKLLNREELEKFLLKKENADVFFSNFKKYKDLSLNDENDHEGTDYEKTNEINSPEKFESSFNQLVSELNQLKKQFETAQKHLGKDVEKYSDKLPHKELHSMGMDSLKHEYFGKNENEFLRKAIEIFGQDNYKRLNKDMKIKFDNRIKNYYETEF